jgi:2-polyprenyl-6-methoxyphenol hydroxylase-like FAD-dependent oxidoreductase
MELGDAGELAIRPEDLIAEGRTKIREGAGADIWFDEMAGDLPSEFGNWIRDHRGEIKHPFVLDVLCHLLPRWTKPGLVLLGDAAHPMSPVGAQGINIALRDVIEAANQLVPALAGNPDPGAVDAACNRFEADRSREAAAIQRLQRIPPRILLRGAWWSEAILQLSGSLLRSRFAQSHRRLPSVARSFLFGTEGVKLRV